MSPRAGGRLPTGRHLERQQFEGAYARIGTIPHARSARCVMPPRDEGVGRATRRRRAVRAARLRARPRRARRVQRSRGRCHVTRSITSGSRASSTTNISIASRRLIDASFTRPHAGPRRDGVRPSRPRGRSLALRVQARVPRRRSEHVSGSGCSRVGRSSGGDVNVAPTDSDIFHPDAFVGLDARHGTGTDSAGSRPGCRDWSTWTSSDGDRTIAASRGGTTASGTHATSACASTAGGRPQSRRATR